ncbi:MAG: Maf family nucleotide pyrophosphatase [Bacteroidota bacterium]
MLTKKLILASKSPRRSQLLTEAGIPFTIRTQDVEESFPSDLAPEKVSTFLAEKKAAAMEGQIGEGEIILTADSVVILDQTIFNKPENYEDAFRMLRELSGKMHRVITGVCLMSEDKKQTFAGSSKVYFDDLSDAEIEYYINNFQPYDKAGAYAIQEWIGWCKIKHIEGSYSNIMGLPVRLVYEALKHF